MKIVRGLLRFTSKNHLRYIPCPRCPSIRSYSSGGSTNKAAKLTYFGSLLGASLLGFGLYFKHDLPLVHGRTIDEANSNNNDKKIKRKILSKDMNFIADIVEEISPSVVFLSCSLETGNSWIPSHHMSSGSGIIMDTNDGII